jgi:citrate lyase beta subunit
VINCKEILEAGKERVIAATFGADDFTADFEIYRPDNGEDRVELDYARKHIAMVCHSFGIVSLDTPFVNFKNKQGL